MNITGETIDSKNVKVDAPNPILVDMWPRDNEIILSPAYDLHCVTSNANNVDFTVTSGLLGNKWTSDKNNYFQHWYNYTEGIHTIKATIWNWGGENIVIERKVIYDLTPPETIYNILEPKYIPDKIYVSPKTIIELNATDNLSGIKFIYNTNYIQIKNLYEGIQNIKYKAIDKANNIEQEKLLILNVDSTAPQTIITIGEPKYNLGAEEPVLISSKTPITLSAIDPTVSGVSSGVAKIEYKIGLLGNWQEFSSEFYITGSDADYTIYYRAIDNVGNIETENSIRVRLDNTPPSVEILSPPENSLVNGNLNIFGTVNDLHFDYYKIDYIGNTSTGSIKDQTTIPVTNGVLGIWNTLGLPEGYYTIILFSQDKVLNISQAIVNIMLGKPEFLCSFGGLGEMNKPMFIAKDSSGNLYVTDENNKRVKKYNSDFQFIGDIIEGIKQPQGIAVDFEGNIYVSGHHSLLKYNSTENKIWEMEGFNQPGGIKIGQDGNLYIADRNNNRIAIYSKDGNFIGEIKGYFNKPMDLGFDNQGNIYVADSENDRVVIFDKNYNYITSFGKFGIGAGYFNKPEGIDAKSLIYVTDRNNDCVKIFDKYGFQLCEFGGNGNSEGRFNKPEGVLVDREGNIYVVDRNNNRVQKFGMPEYEKPEQIPILSQVQSKIEIKNHISYPNPFSPNGDGINDYAKIRFELTEEAEVQVKIYNQIGKLVYVYDKINCNAGANEVLWEGVNNAGKRINNGIYIYHIKAKSKAGKVAIASGSIVVVK